MGLHPKYRGVAICNPSKGDTIGLWEDIILGSMLAQKYPSLHGFANDPCISLNDDVHCNNIVDLFKIPMSRQAFNEMQLLISELATFPVNSTEKDSWSFIWNGNKFSVRKFYRHQFLCFNPLNL